MAWWEEIKRYLNDSAPEGDKKEDLKSFQEMIEDIFFRSAVDILYFWLGVFTYLYFFVVAFLYIGGLSFFDNLSLKIVESLAEPYMGAVGIYTILKESRKRKNNSPSKHWGEIFVILWLLLFLVASLLSLFTEFYVFNKTLELITTVALSVGIIYIGGVIHNP